MYLRRVLLLTVALLSVSAPEVSAQPDSTLGAPQADSTLVAPVPGRSHVRSHGEFLMGARFLPDTWRPYENELVLGGAAGVRGGRSRIGLDGGFVFSFAGSGGMYGPDRHSAVLEVFAGAGMMWVAAPRGRFAFVGAGPAFVYGEYRGPHTGDTGSSTSIGFYVRAGGGLFRVSKARLGLEARYSRGANLKLQSVRRQVEGISLSILIGSGH